MKKIKRSIDVRIESILNYLEQTQDPLTGNSEQNQQQLRAMIKKGSIRSSFQTDISTSSEILSPRDMNNRNQITNAMGFKNRMYCPSDKEQIIDSLLLEEVLEENCQTSFHSSRFNKELFNKQNVHGLDNERVTTSRIQHSNKNSSNYLNEQGNRNEDQCQSRTIFHSRRSSYGQDRASGLFNAKSWSCSKKVFRNSSYQRPRRQNSLPRAGHRRHNPSTFSLNLAYIWAPMTQIRKPKPVTSFTLERMQEELKNFTSQNRRQNFENNARTGLIRRVLKSSMRNVDFMTTK